jgi:hypothetical protein
MLSNHDIDELTTKMNIPNFKGSFYKDKLKKIQPNSSYIINVTSEMHEDGKKNTGFRWTCLVADDMKRAIYFDSYGEKAPNELGIH